jgi:DNA-binding transcriptional ArsR family regulator
LAEHDEAGSRVTAITGIVHLVVNDVFGALAHPVRRGIVERLAHGPATVAVATGGLGVSKPAISKHLKVLEEGGVIVRTVEGRTHRLRLNVDTLAAGAAWLDRQRAAWELMFDAVEEQLRMRPGTTGGRS